jgi:hypothetical protein
MVMTILYLMPKAASPAAHVEYNLILTYIAEIQHPFG